MLDNNARDLLKKRTIFASIWSGSDIILRRGFQFLVTIFLARLLTPDDFGTIALLYLFLGVAGLFIDSGFSSALIQRHDISPDDESTVFWFNLGVGVIVALSLCLASPAIAGFFEKPVLRPLTCVMALNLLISAFGSVHTALLTKALDFRKQMKIGVVASSISGTAAIILAWRGAGVWALAVQSVTATVITVLLLWWRHDWRPRLRFSFPSLRSLFGFGSYLLLSGLMSTLYSRLHTVLIGKMYSVRELGYYSRAAGTQGLPINILTGVIDRVGFPAFTLAAADTEFFRRSVRKVLRGAMLINAPAMLGILVTAKPLVATLFGDRWEPSVPILQVLCLAGVLWPLHVINLNVLMAQGHSNLFFRVGVAKQVLGVSVLLAASPFGILAIAWSEVVTGLASFLLNAHYTKVLLGYSALRQFRDFFPSLTVATLMAGIMWMVSLGIPSQCAAVQLMAQVFTGLFVYAGLCKLLRLEAFEEAWAILVGNLRQVHTDSTGQ